MEFFAGVVGFIFGNVICDIRHPEIEQQVIKPVEPQVVEKIVEKNVYPTGVAYVVDLKSQPVKVIVLKEGDIKKIMK